FFVFKGKGETKKSDQQAVNPNPQPPGPGPGKGEGDGKDKPGGGGGGAEGGDEIKNVLHPQTDNVIFVNFAKFRESKLGRATFSGKVPTTGASLGSGAFTREEILARTGLQVEDIDSILRSEGSEPQPWSWTVVHTTSDIDMDKVTKALGLAK